MLLLCSDGLTSGALQQETGKYIHGLGKAAVVVTADNEYKEKNYHVGRVMQELEQLGMHAECFDIDMQPADLLLQYDVVEFIGGNPYYLLNALRKTNCRPILEKIASDKHKLLIGWSAGAVVMGKSMELIDRYTPEMNFVNLTDLSGMELTDIFVLPHYSKFFNRFERFEERCREFEKEQRHCVLRIDDGDGIFIIDNLMKLVKDGKCINIHQMSLNKKPFEKMFCGEKTIEVRCNDEKRQKLKVDDIILFQLVNHKDKYIIARVKALYPFQTFHELYSAFDFSEFGCTGYTMEQMLNETTEIYSAEKELKYGALGIRVEKIGGNEK